ncbi:unnamed protein product [Rotaria magnacalcarata]|uniref:Trs120/TRAPPC9 TPR region domain-containing protein n=1 Tax=Rotaria magnacalcarata TaxID=392030 RepID=A0A816P037_9BILA|nr:unnamed protein product [Rotaria magnacalcarata]CAF3950206.1 unnamed protein product [Rotaria magnacalcarata]
MFRQFFDTSFTDYRQVRVVLQELPDNPLKESSPDFQRFATNIFNHKNYTFEHFKVEYCYVKRSLTVAEAHFNEIQLYRRPFGFIFFTVCHTSEELRIVLEEFFKIKQREKDVCTHLFVRYRTKNSEDDDDDDDDEVSIDEKLNIATNDETSSEYIASARPSFSSITSLDGCHSLSQPASLFKLQESISHDDNSSVTSDPPSLTNSFNGTPIFKPLAPDTPDEVVKGEDATATITINLTQSNDQTIKKARPPLLKSKTITTTNLFDSFDSDLTRVLHRLETSLSKPTLDPKGFNTLISSIDSQFADIRLMINSEKDCTLLESKYSNGLDHDRMYTSVLNEFDMRIMKIVFNQYLNASPILNNESLKTKLSKKIIEARTIKRKGDCCLLLGAMEKAQQDYQRAAEALKTQNDTIWLAAALEARVASSYLSTHKPKRHMQKTISFFKQISLTRKIPVEKYLNRSNTPLSLHPKIEMAIQMYNTGNRSLFNKMEFQLELDLCLRWCAVLQEQIDAKKHHDDIIQYIDRINILGSYLEEHIDSIYLNTYLAESYASIGFKRKSALYYRSAAFSGLTLLNEQESYHEEINLFDRLIKEARKGYGIDDNQLIFPLIQKTILNESIQISLQKNDFTTIIENVHFAIECLLDNMTDAEVEALLSFLKASDQSISCGYCSIPRLKSLDLMPLSNQLKAWKAEPKNSIFIYHAKRAVPAQQQSLHRKVDFYWVKNERAQIGLVVENYLPAAMIIDRLDFITENELLTTLDTTYRIPPRTTKCLSIDCIPKEVGQLRILGLRYHIWSTNQVFRFGDFPTIRQCLCSIDVVDELPILDVEYLLVNDTKIELIDKSTTYNTQVHRGEELFVTLRLINSSLVCDVDSLEIQVFAYGSNMTEYVKIFEFDLPILISNSIEPKIDLTEIYNRCLARQDRSTVNLECLTIELRLNYSNESSNTSGYYRKNIVELRLDYIASVTFEINDIQNDEDDLSYLMCCAIDNHLSEGAIFQNNTVKPSESSLVLLKRDKIKLNGFPSDLNQLIADIRTQLPLCIHYRTTDSNKQLNLPIDWQHFSNDKIQNHLYDLVQLPYTCFWHFERIVNTLRINLCVQAKYYQISKLEFSFPTSNDIRFLNSNKIIFDKIEVGKYLMAERILMFSQENNSDIIVVDIRVNNIQWKRLTLTF